jgi:hypothetical protein
VNDPGFAALLDRAEQLWRAGTERKLPDRIIAVLVLVDALDQVAERAGAMSS